ncbi:flagellar hook-length control protein FliK [Atlantibacter sp.]|uniref:flagellar hook-length control protein FliK n=1 Tax=Atlantibacter sp. TaxID=1903473 RepID=UPI00289F613C|nr:flagellar hook-length control protein FliK [Atlantibacter sp.]
MITLSKILVAPESEAATSVASDKTAPETGSFLDLLSQAIPGLGEGKTLNLDALTAGTQKLALKPGDVDDAGEQADKDASTLLDALLAGLNAPVNAQPQTADGLESVARNIAGLKDDKKLNEQDMAALSALFAMLPHQQTATLNTADSQSLTTANIASATGMLAKAVNGDVPVDGKSDAKALTNGEGANVQAQPAVAGVTDQPRDVVHAANHADKLFHDSNANSPATPPAMQPMVSSATATATPAANAAIATPHTALLNAQLGTSEWQHALGQQVTLMTRNGQQTAELRLNPEALGQVHITMKIDDNLAQMQFVSPHSHVRAALEAALPTLRTQLAESGIQLGQSDISNQNFSGQQQQQGQSQQSGSRGGTFSFGGQNDEGVAAPASLQRIARGDNAVDIFA